MPEASREPKIDPVEEARVSLPLELLACPLTHSPLHWVGQELQPAEGAARYAVSAEGIPLFAETFLSNDARVQQSHYDTIASAYVENLAYPHTQEYMAYLDRVFEDVARKENLGVAAEICCGRGEAFLLLADQMECAVGVDISESMLISALSLHGRERLTLLQGDATMLPLASESFDSVCILGGIHHVSDRQALFSEVARILKPGGRFYFREPLSDFFLWRWLRWGIYRLSPILDHATERPLRHRETVPLLEAVGSKCEHWSSHGFLGFCFFMNSDVLFFNRLFRFIPGIRAITRASIGLDRWMLRLPGLTGAGLQVVGVALKPKDSGPKESGS